MIVKSQHCLYDLSLVETSTNIFMCKPQTSQHTYYVQKWCVHVHTNQWQGSTEYYHQYEIIERSINIQWMTSNDRGVIMESKVKEYTATQYISWTLYGLESCNGSWVQIPLQPDFFASVFNIIAT